MTPSEGLLNRFRPASGSTCWRVQSTFGRYRSMAPRVTGSSMTVEFVITEKFHQHEISPRVVDGSCANGIQGPERKELGMRPWTRRIALGACGPSMKSFTTISMSLATTPERADDRVA
jgi:hypothetical protein